MSASSRHGQNKEKKMSVGRNLLGLIREGAWRAILAQRMGFFDLSFFDIPLGRGETNAWFFPESPLHSESRLYYTGARQWLISCHSPPPTTLGKRILVLSLQQKSLKISRFTNFRGVFSHLGGTHKAFANINGISFDIFKDQRIQENMQAGWAFEIRAPKCLEFQVKEEKKKKQLS